MSAITRTVAISSLCAAALLLPPIAGAATICVPADAAGCDGNQPTINAAVAAAADDDTIQIAAGTYQEQVLTAKRLNFVGAGAGTLDSPAGSLS